MNIKGELEKLIKNIYIPTVFYIPNALFPNLSTEVKLKLAEEQFFNTLGIIDANENVSTLNNWIKGTDIFKKSHFLKINFIQLVEFENNLTREAFSHLINEYLNSTYAYNHVYSWMANHIEQDIPTISDDYKKFFLHQAEVIKSHILEISDRFLVIKEDINAVIDFDRIFDNGKKELIKDDYFKTFLNQNTPISRLTKSEKRKMLLPADEEVDNMLLASIFNVDFLKL